MDRIKNIMGRWHRHRELEVYITTFDGAQHLRLHGWLKRNDTLIKAETIANKEDIEKFLIQANETSLALFKKNDEFIDDYVETPEMSAKDKVKDLDLMIEAFVEQERYEDCALLVKIKDKIIKNYKQQKIKKL